MAIYALILAALASATATLLLRYAGSARTSSLLVHWFLPGCAIGAYGLGFLAYGYALRSLQASFAYPLMIGLALMATVLASWLLLGENLSLRSLLGMAFLLAGIVLMGAR